MMQRLSLISSVNKSGSRIRALRFVGPSALSGAGSSTVRHCSALPEPAPRRRRVIKDKDPLIITDRAADRIRELLHAKNDTHGIRLGTKRRGCNGLSYTMNYVEDLGEVKKDIHMKSHEISIYIEPMALFNVVGTTMDWVETELSSEFTFANPNSKGECGCGESFNV